MRPAIWLKIVMSSEDQTELDVAWDYALENGLAFEVNPKWQNDVPNNSRAIAVPLHQGHCNDDDAFFFEGEVSGCVRKASHLDEAFFAERIVFIDARGPLMFTGSRLLWAATIWT